MSAFVVDLSGNDPFKGVTIGDPATQKRGFQSFILAGDARSKTGITLAVNQASPPIYNVTGDSYVFFASATFGAAGAIQLQYLGNDGTWYNIDTARTTSGSGTVSEIVGDDSTIRIVNTGTNTITNVFASLGGGSATIIAPPSLYPDVTAALLAAKSNSSRASIAFLGDSTKAGWGSGVASGTGAGSNPGGGGNNIRSKSAPQQFGTLMAAAGFTVRSDAVFGSGVTTNNTTAEEAVYNPDLTFGGADIVISTQLVPGGRPFQFNNTGTSSMTFTPKKNANSFDIYYLTSTGNATLTVTDASGTLATINQSAIGSFTKVTVTRALANVLPISIQRNGTGSTGYICAIVPFNSLIPELEIWNMGYAGSKASDWQLSVTAWNPFNAILAFNPTLWIVNLGLNDVNSLVGASAYEASLRAVVAQAQRVAPVILEKPSSASAGSPYLLDNDYLTAISNVAASQNVRYTIDLFNNLTFPTTQRFDGVHMSESGYLNIASYERDLLLPALRLQ